MILHSLKSLLLLFFSLRGSTTSKMLNSSPNQPRYNVSSFTNFQENNQTALYSFELLHFLSTWELLRKGYFRERVSLPGLGCLIRTCIYLLFSLCKSHPSLLSPSAHSVDSIPTALNPCYMKDARNTGFTWEFTRNADPWCVPSPTELEYFV